MRISSKGRYGLAAMISIATQKNTNDQITILSISEKLGISKIYLEQVFSLLKRSGLVISIKGSQGGYRLSRPADIITVYDIMFAIEASLFEKTEQSVSENATEIENTMQALVFDMLDDTVYNMLKKITLYDLAQEAQRHNLNNNFMFYI